MPRKAEPPKPRGRGRPRIVPGTVPKGARWHSLLISEKERTAINALLAKLRAASP